MMRRCIAPPVWLCLGLLADLLLMVLPLVLLVLPLVLLLLVLLVLLVLLMLLLLLVLVVAVPYYGGAVASTPIQVDWTDREMLQKLRWWYLAVR